MARDFAKRRQSAGNQKTPGRRKPAPRSSPRATRKSPQQAQRSAWRLYGAGVFTGVFLSFLLYLGTLPSPGGMTAQEQSEPQVSAEAPKPRFDFYTLLPEQTIEVELEPGEIAQPRSSAASTSTTELYLLQAGSFRQRKDADRRRAELLLLGLEPKVEEANGDNGRWYRVYVGPFDSRSKMARARSLTANQDIDTLLLKRGSP